MDNVQNCGSDVIVKLIKLPLAALIVTNTVTATVIVRCCKRNGENKMQRN
jgi:hypothetical protein